MFKQHELYMQRCLQLAVLGAGNVAPNPMVGSVLVHENKIIGEGYHAKYGEAHAEVNCIASVKEPGRQLIAQSTLYVSLEPCAHYGKTPPCSDLIIQQKIPKVVIGCRDLFEKVDGKGIEKLRTAGVEVITGVLEKECKMLNKRFFTFHSKKRPYIILKWAQTDNQKIATTNYKRLIISNIITNKLVHKLRSEEASILVGTNTALVDNPLLTNRLWTGKNPVRLVVDKNLKLPKTLRIFNNDAPVIIFNELKNSIEPSGDLISGVNFYKIENNKGLVQQIAEACYHLNIQSILIEGGARLLQSFIDEKLFDELRIITNKNLLVEDGVAAPNINLYDRIAKRDEFSIKNDLIEFFL